MKFENEFCGACHCSGNGKFDYGPYLFCPACGHIYIWSLKSNLKHFFVETFPLEIRKRRKKLHEYEKQTKEVPPNSIKGKERIDGTVQL